MLKCKKFRGQAKGRIRKRWLFHATDFQSLMSLNFTICKIFGIFPYKITHKTFEISKPHYIHFIVIICLICIYELAMFYELNFSGNVRLDVPKTISYNSHFILGIFLAVLWYILNGSRMRLLQMILEVSWRLPPESYQKLSKLIHAKDIFSCFIFLWTWSMLLLNPSEMAIDTLHEPLRLYIALLVLQMDMLYVNCVCVLKACFEEINNNLENLRKCMMNDISARICQETNILMLIKLKALKKQHLMICNTVQILNIIFNIQLLITMVICFKQITFFLYFHIVQWHDGISIRLDEQIQNEFFLSHIIYYLTRVTLIVWACETGKNETVKINTTVHNALNSISDEQIKYELRLFSLQLMHRKNIFALKGFTINATLLTTVINNITMYLLILIQFLITEHSCDGIIAINITQTI